MKYLKLALISLFVFAALITVLSLFFPSDVRISKAIDIRAPKDSVLAFLKNTDRWQDWYPGLDTIDKLQVMRRTMGYRVSEQGAILRKTEATDSSVRSEISGAGVKDVKGGWNVYPAGDPEMVTVQWFLDFRLKWYPWEKFSSITFEKRYGPMLEQGLEKLKRLAER